VTCTATTASARSSPPCTTCPQTRPPTPSSKPC
jgi:hypothetical protein